MKDKNPLAILPGSMLVAALLLSLWAVPAAAQPGTLLRTITTPVLSPTGVAIGIAADCEDPATLFYTHTYTAVLHRMDSSGIAIGAGIPIIDSVTGGPVSIGAIQWDETRKMLWGGTDNSTNPVSVYLVDPNTGVATYQFTSVSAWVGFTDGITYDGSTDTVYVSDDVSPFIDEHDATAPHNLVRTLIPTDAGGNQLGTISGVLVGKGDLLYVGRNGLFTVDQVKKSDGSFLGSFAAPGYRVEDLECDLTSFPGKEAIWVKDAYNDQVAAFEVEAGTCQCGGIIVIDVDIDIKFCSDPNAFNCKSKGKTPVTVFGTSSLKVADIDIGSLQLCDAADLTNCTGAPLAFSYADRGDPTTDIGAAMCALDPLTGEQLDWLNPDGFLDLDVAFDTQELVNVIGCDGLGKGDASLTLVLIGQTTNGTPITSVPIGDVGIDQLLIKN